MTTSFLTYLPFVISFSIGLLLMNMIVKSDNFNLSLFNLSLSSLLGIGLSAMITFTSFVFFNKFHQIYTVLLHFAILGVLTYFNRNQFKAFKISCSYKEIFSMTNLWEPLIFIALLIPCWIQANSYPYGGWDAWSTWNLKAKILLLSGDNWKVIFDPILWRSSPHYPLLLPLTNVWGWSFIGKPIFQVTIFTTFLFTLLTHSLLFSSIKRIAPTPFAILSVSSLLTLKLYIKQSTSQYCDIVIAAYLLAAAVALIVGKKENNLGFYILAGIFLGFLSFTKPEGHLAALLLGTLSIVHILWGNASIQKNKHLLIFILVCVLSFIPTLLFALFLAPENITFVNGLASTSSPSTFGRLQFIFAFYLIKMINIKWSYLWIILFIGLLFSLKQAFSKHIVMIPLFLASYTAITTAYYFINTHFEVGWWLQVTFDRVYGALLPLIVFWIFYSVGKLKNQTSRIKGV